ncbi:MAG: preprotein translocase subunit SecY [Candidatus Dojkabacteria bacterium]
MLKQKLESFGNIFKTVEIRQKIIFSLIVIIIFRLLASIPVVGIPADAIKKLFEGVAFGDTISAISGGVLETASVIAIGISPYISASIVLQLAGSFIPKLEELRKEGTQGQRIIGMYTRYLTVPLSILQAFVIYSTLRGFGFIDALDPLKLTALISTLTGGALLIMWIAELVGEGGLANGSSYIMFLGILANVPGLIRTDLQNSDPLEITLFFLAIALIIGVVVLVSDSERRVKLMYSRRVRSGGTQDNYLPIKLTQFGVMPVIFAGYLVSVPVYVARFLVSKDYSDQITKVSNSIIDFLGNSNVYNIGTAVLVILFSFFYITIVFNPKEIAENLQKQGAFVPGIRPGVQTEKYLRTIAYRLTFFGSIFLAVLAVLPNLLVNFGIISTTIISGTGLLIVVGVALDIRRKIESMIVVRSYDRYI